NTASNNGAGFAVYYGNEQVNPESGIQLTKTADNKYVLDFSARYAKVGTGIVESGDVASSLTMTVVTD
ncbi:TPA: fimbrial chaperone protein, partial [Citrobacter freundii]